MTPEELDWFLQFYKKHFQCQGLDSAWKDFGIGCPTARPRLAITFDDGQLDNYLYAAPVLQKHNLKATFFIPVAAIDNQELLWHDKVGYSIRKLAGDNANSDLLVRLGIDSTSAMNFEATGVSLAKQWSPEERNNWILEAEARVSGAVPDWDGMMTWKQLQQLSQYGHEIGSHSHTHPLLVQCDDFQLEEEIAGSRKKLEENLGVEVTSFCYPNGDHDKRVAEAVKRAGYQLAVTTRWGSNFPGCNGFSLNRHDMVARNSQDRLGRLSDARVAMRMTGFVRGVK